MKRAISTIAITGFVVSLLAGVSAAQDDPLTVQTHCSVATLRGEYGFYRTGMEPVGPIAGLGLTVFDGRGGSKTRQTIRVNGITTLDLFTDGVFEATYTVNFDCSAKFMTMDGTIFAHAVVVDGGKEVFILSLSDDNTIAGVMKKVH